MKSLDGIVKELMAERDRLDAAIAALKNVSNPATRKGTLSAAARARIAAAQRKRWAKVKAKNKVA